MENSAVVIIILLFLMILIVPISKKIKLGAVVGYFIAGVLAGPQVLNLVRDVESVRHISELGVVFFLFIIGLELDPKKLWQLRLPIFGLGLLQVGIVSFGLFLMFLTLNLSWQQALISALGLSLSSTAIAVQLLKDKNLFNTSGGQNAFSVLLFQDMSVVPMLALIPLLSNRMQSSGDSSFFGFIKIPIAIVAIILVGHYGLRYVFSFIASTKLKEVFTALCLLIVLGLALLMQELGVSAALGAFLGGVILANSEYRHAIETDLEPFKGLLLGLFFMGVGMSLDMSAIVQNPLLVVGLLVAVTVIKILLQFALAIFFKLEKHEAAVFSISISQIGEFSFVLFGLAVGFEIIGSDWAAKLIAIAALSMALTPLFFNIWDKLYSRRVNMKNKIADKIENDEPEVIIAGFGRVGQIIARLLFAHKLKATVLDYDSNQIETLRRFGFKVYFGDATRLDLLESAGIAQAKVLVVAIDGVEDSLRLVDIVQKHHPKIKIIARARNVQHCYELIARGVELFERETFESSLSLGTKVLVELGWSHRTAVKASNVFRDHNLQMIHELSSERGNQQNIISKSKQARIDLEKMMDQEQLNRENNSEGWS
jgi:glutathione-regulated potassium-efflux system ancillary protein KefC